MQAVPRQIVILRLENGESPFEDWLDRISDSLLVRAIDSRITRVRDGNFGDHKRIGEGVFELRI
jgi:putative addiction module killer protein